MLEENEKYLATIPVYRRIDAVYADFNKNGEVIEIYKLPVVGILITCEKDYHHTYIYYTPLTAFGGDGTIEEMVTDKYFLGLEFDGKQKDWSKEIALKKETWRKIIEERKKRELRMKASREKTKKNQS